MLLRHGVRSCREYAKTGDVGRARTQSNPDLSPQMKFVDMGGHGYAVVTATTNALEAEFVCIPRPLEHSERADGGPLRYRIRSRTALGKKGEAPKLEVEILEGDPKFSV
jgi:alkaline phosphatase D